MPKMTVLLGRKAVQSYDLDQDTISVGRDEEMDIMIDNPSVSRRHVEFGAAVATVAENSEAVVVVNEVVEGGGHLVSFRHFHGGTNCPRHRPRRSSRAASSSST